MARLPRLVLPGCAHHVIQRGHSGGAIFLDEEDRRTYLAVLHEAARAERVAVHAYALLDAKVHLLVTPENDTGLSRMMQAVGRRYVRAFNARHGRSGTLWDGRFRAALVDADAWALRCMRYIDTRAVREGGATQPGEHPWTSYRHHVGLARDPLVSEHARYWALGNTPFDREAAYRRFVADDVPADEEARIAGAAERGWALGSEAFLARAAASTARPLAPRPRGRPRKAGSAAGP